MATAYLYLAAAIIFEVLGTITMKYSEGFTKVTPVVLTLICHGICFVALAMALKSLPIGMVYAVWAGVGTALMAFLGMMFFNEPLAFHKVAATFLIILGVIMLNVSPNSEQEKSDQQVARAVKEPASVHTLKPIPLSLPAENESQISSLAERNSG